MTPATHVRLKPEFRADYAGRGINDRVGTVIYVDHKACWRWSLRA